MKPESGEFSIELLSTPDGGTPDSPVRQTKAALGFLAPCLFEPFLFFCIGVL
jgi:hypothetical protein